jgi:hypothetical protein
MRSTLTCICLIMTALAAGAAEEDWPADALSRTAIARNQETLERVKPCALEMTWKPDPAQPKYSTAILKYKGTWIFTDWQRPEPPGRPGLRGAGHTRAVFNDAYIAFTRGDSPGSTYQEELDGSPKSAETILQWKQSQLPRNPLAFAFGNGDQTLKEAIDDYLKAFAAVAEEVTDDAGRRVVRMKVYPKTDSGPADARWAYDFDPARGYAITRLAAMLGMKPFIEYQVELQPGERPGTWLPRHISRPNPPGLGDPEEFDVRILPGADLSDASFRIAALKLPPDHMLARMHPDGVSGSYVYLVDGVWVSDRIAGRLGPAPGTAPKVGAVGSNWPPIYAAIVFVAGLILFICTGGPIRRGQDRSERK